MKKVHERPDLKEELEKWRKLTRKELFEELKKALIE